MFRNSLMLLIVLLLQNMLSNCEMIRQNASECGASFYIFDKIPENCQPKVCGIRTWTVPESEKFLKESQTLTSLIFDKGIIQNR